MSAKDEGIFVPRRLMFIMIFVSLCVNVFFLLMGILIGKDDIKWKEQEGESLPEMTVSGDPDPQQALEDELSMFEEPKVGKRPPPIDEKILKTPQETTRREEPRETPKTQAPPADKPKPEPARPKPRVDKPERAAASGSPVYWVQVMAISDRAKAQGFLDKVKSKGFKAVMVNEGAFHKIRVGPYRERARADKARADVSKGLGVNGWVVKK